MSFAIGNTRAANARLWHLVDARGQILGHLSRGIAAALTGELKPVYTPHQDIGDHVVVIHARNIVSSGDKARWKKYYTHSGYPGGMKEKTLGEMMEQNPEEVIRRAVAGMLPKDKLRAGRLGRLHIFEEDKHPYRDNFAKWHEYPELEKINSRMLYKMSAEETVKMQDEMQMKKLEDLIREFEQRQQK